MRILALSLVTILAFGSIAAPGTSQPAGWTPDLRVSVDDAFSGFSDLEVGPNGSAHVVWVDDRNPNTEIYYRRINGSGVFGTLETRLTNDSSYSLYPAVALAPGGLLARVVWVDGRDGNSEIYFRAVDGNGITVVPDTRLTSDPADSALPDIACDPLGGIHVVWVDGRLGNAEIYYKKIDPTGGAMTPDIPVTIDPAVSWDPALVADAAGFVHVVWVDDRDLNAEIYYQRLDASGSLVGANVRLTFDGANSAFPSIGLDALGLLHVAWVDDRNGNADIYYRKATGTGFTLTPELPLTTDPGASWFPSIDGDPGGRAQVAWIDDRDGNLEVYMERLRDNGVTVVDDLRVTFDASESILPSAVSDAYGGMVVAWQDARDLPAGNEEVYQKRTLRPTVSVVGTPAPGNTISFNLADPMNPGASYLVALALGSSPGTPLADGRTVPLNGDFVFFASIFSSAVIGLSNTLGSLDSTGQATATWAIPAWAPSPLPPLVVGFVTLDNSLTLPAEVVSISTAVPL